MQCRFLIIKGENISGDSEPIPQLRLKYLCNLKQQGEKQRDFISKVLYQKGIGGPDYTDDCPFGNKNNPECPFYIA